MRLRLRHRLSALLLLLGLTLSAGQASALTVEDVRIGLHPGKTRIVIELDEMSRFRTFVLADPWRLVVDLPSFDWQVGKISNPKAGSILTVRQGPLDAGVSRIMIDLKEPVSIIDAFLLRRSEGKPDRLVIDFERATEAQWRKEGGKSFGLLETKDQPMASAARPRPPEARPVARAPEPAPEKTEMKTAAAPLAPPIPPPAPPQQAKEFQQAAVTGMAVPQKKPSSAAPPPPPPQHQHQPQPGGRKKPLIVIDPGHGGVDPGAIGANGIFEKHIALSMAKELKRLLENTGRYDVRLTRDSDTYLRLYQRVDIARAGNADLFISIHADSIGKSGVSGASVYTLSEKASDEQTARLAERENKADIIAGTDLSHEDEQVANILIDLAMRDTMNQSAFFANTVLASMKRGNVKTLDSDPRHAGFAVLKAPDVPSVLVELGFMSNKSEAQMLASPDYRQKIGRALVASIDAYFEKVARNERS